MKNKTAYTILGVLFLSHFLISLFLLKDFVNNFASFQYIGYSATDMEFYSRGMIISYEGNYTKSLGNAVRLPFYPILISFFIDIFDKPVLMIKLFQIFLSSSIVVVSFFTIRNFINDNKFSLFGTIPFFFWIPLYYFSPILIVESISVFFTSLFVLTISYMNKNNYKKVSIAIAFLIAILVLFKSNNAVLFLPFSIYLFFILDKSFTETIKYILVSLIVFIILIMPWSIFVSQHNKTIIPFSVLGPNAMLYGMGQKVEPTANNLINKVIRKYNIYDKEVATSVRKNVNLVLNTNAYADKLSEMIQQNINPYTHRSNKLAKEYFNLDVEVGGKNIVIGNENLKKIIEKEWDNKTNEYILLGFAKVLHGFGMSFRGIVDITIFFTFIISILGILKYRLNYTEKYLFFYMSMIFSYAFQAFLVYGDHKYRAVLFDFSMILTISLLLIFIFMDFNIKNKIKDKL
ncbi:hypothetical protein [Sulfurimonas sp.]